MDPSNAPKLRIAVFGATGIQGLHQVRLLSQTHHTVIPLSRTATTLSLPNNQTIQTTAADFADPDSLAPALEGITTIFLNLPSTSFTPSGPILAAAQAIGQAAKEADVQLIVFNTSMPVPAEPQGIVAQDDRREMRRLLRASGVPVISIEPVVYLDNLLEGWALPPIRDRTTLVYCHKPSLEVSWICQHDVGQLMLAAAERPQLAGRDFAVGGPETVRLVELAAKLSRAWGRELGCENQSVADFCEDIARTMAGRGLESQSVVDQMFKAYTYYNEAEDRPFKIDMRPVLELLPVRLTPIEEWAAGRRPPGW